MQPNFRRFFLIWFITLTFSIENVRAQCYQPMYLTVVVNGKYGGADQKTGEIKIPALFNYASPFRWPFLKVAEKDEGDKTRWGLANEKGELVLPMKYTSITALECEHFVVKEGKALTLLDKNFKPLFESNADWLSPYRQFNRVVEGRKLNDTLTEISLRDLTSGKMLYQKTALSMYPVQQRYHKSGSQHRNLPFMEVRLQNAKKTYKAASNTTTTADQHKEILDLNGNVLFDSLQWLDVFENIALMKRNNVAMVADSTFKVNKGLSYKYEFVQWLTYPPKWFAVTKNKKTGIADRNGKIIIPPEKEGQFTYVGKNAFLFFNHQATDYKTIYFSDGRVLDLSNYSLGSSLDTLLLHRPMIVKNRKSYKSGLLTSDGKLLLSEVYDNLSYVDHNKLVFFKGDGSGYLDQNGKVIFSGNYTALSAFTEGYAIAAKYAYERGYPCAMVTSQIGKPSYATLYTFIDSTGKQFPGGFYESVSPFREGVAQAVVNCRPFMIDKQGKTVMYGKHFLASHFNQDVALISDKKFKKFGLVHRSGKILAAPIYDKIETEMRYNYPFTSTIAAQNAYSQNVNAFLIPKIEAGTVKATNEDKKNYKHETTEIAITP